MNPAPLEPKNFSPESVQPEELQHEKIAVFRGAIDATAYFLRNYTKRTLLVMIFTLVIGALEAIGASTLLPLLDIGLNRSTQAEVPFKESYAQVMALVGLPLTFYSLLGALVLAWLFKVGANVVLGIYVDFAKELIANHFRERTIKALSLAKLSLFTQQSSGIIVNLLNQEADRAAGTFTMIPTVLISGVTFVVYVAFGVTVSLEMMVGVLALAIVSTVVIKPLFTMAYRAGRGQTLKLRSMSDEAMNGLFGYKVFKAMAKEKELLRALGQQKDDLVAKRLLQAKASRYLQGVQELLVLLSLVAGVFIGLEVLGLKVSELGFMGVVLLKSYGQLTTFQKKLQALSGLQFVHRHFEETIHGFERASEEHVGKRILEEPIKLRLEHVSFKHEKRQILKDVNLELPPTGMISIIGPSGSGKTTLIDLICGFYVPVSGSIQINGINLRDVDIKWWRSRIGYVSQVPMLLNDTIYRNVAGFSPDISEQEAERALYRAGVKSLIDELPHGIHTNVGEAGGRLSGGEKQRIAVARALAQKPKLLILDEPTSSVDKETEEILLQTFAQLRKEIAILAISHQPNITRVSDRILEMYDGKLHELTAIEGQKRVPHPGDT